MLRRVDTFLAPPLFVDVLSGEFQPPSDPEGRSHQLSRLAYRTYEAGIQSPHTKYGYSVEYTPSWAQDVVSKVGCDYYFDDNFSVLRSLSLRTAAGQELALHTHPVNGKNILHINHNGGRDSLTLELGASLVKAQAEVTELAQAFFDTVER